MDKFGLGRLRILPLREAWKYEAHDFTPWLAAHLDTISDLIGIPLELEGQEVSVGNFYADILARNSQNDTLVLIENQLERSDHTHLGQIMTYLSGLEAHTVIWIAQDFNESHISALHWLNEQTPDDFGFFAIRVQAVRIEDSPIAPLFEVVSKPNAWEQQLKKAARETAGMSELGQFRKRFWSHYLARHPEEEKYGPVFATSSRWRELADLGVVISLYLSRNEVGIFMRGPVGTERTELAEQLEPVADQLSERLKVPMGDPARSQLFADRLPCDPHKESDWDKLVDWLFSRSSEYEEVIRDLIG